MTPRSRRILGLLIAVPVAYAAAVWAAHALISAVYSGALLPGLLENRATRPLDHYYSIVDRLVLGGFFLIGIVAATIYLARRHSALLVLATLLAGDVIFCLLSERYGGLLDVRLDGGLPEWFQYFKEGGIALMFLAIFRQTRKTIFIGWGCLFGFLLVDDALKYHERMGVLFGRIPFVARLAEVAQVRAVDIGEMLSLAPILIALAVFLPIPYLRETASVRAVVHRLIALLAGLIAFGGAMDLIDRVAVTQGSDLVAVLSLIEDGGEMMILSAMFAYVLTLLRNYECGRIR